MASTPHIMAIDIGQTSTALWLAAADLSRSAYREVSGFRHRIETAPDGSCPDLAEAVEGAVASLLADLDCAPARVKAVWCSAQALRRTCPSGCRASSRERKFV